MRLCILFSIVLLLTLFQAAPMDERTAFLRWYRKVALRVETLKTDPSEYKSAKLQLQQADKFANKGDYTNAKNIIKTLDNNIQNVSDFRFRLCMLFPFI
jgi:hypothetical protein